MHVTVTNVSPREYFDLVASIRSTPVDFCGCAVVLLHVGGMSMLSFSGQCWPVRCCYVLCGFLLRVDGAKRQTKTSVGEVTAEEGREKFLCTQPGIEPATSRLWDEDGTTRPLPVHDGWRYGRGTYLFYYNFRYKLCLRMSLSTVSYSKCWYKQILDITVQGKWLHMTNYSCRYVQNWWKRRI
jgi:hypothetical protein